MARDRTDIKTHVIRNRYHNPVDGSGKRRLYTSKTYGYRKKAARDDAKSSDGIRPTAYWAYRYSQNPKFFRYQSIWPSVSFGKLGFESWEGLKYPEYGFGRLDYNLYDFRFPKYHDQIALNRCLQKVNDSELDLGTNLAEANENIRFIANALKSFAKALSKFRQRKYGEAIRELTPNGDGADKAADAYLAFKFGVQPLAQDVWNALEALREALKLEGILHAEGFSSAEAPPNYGLFNNKIIDGTITQGTKIGVYYRVVDPARYIQSHFGLDNPLRVAWNVVPLSFVIDWFLNVGQVLSNLSIPVSTQFIGGYKTRFSRGSYTVTERLSSSWVGTAPSAEISIDAFERRILVEWPSPSLYFRFPLDTGKLVTALALIRQRS